METRPKILVSIVGPTAVGKTALAINLAQHFETEIVSVDSRQLYREMEIGTAKPSLEELGQVPHHFINHLSIHQSFTVGDYEKEAISLLDQLFKKHTLVIAVGGSGLFFKALWEGFDEMPEVKPGLREELNARLQTEGLEPLLLELQAADPEYFEKVDKMNPQRVIRAIEVIRSSGKPFSSFRIKKSQNRPFSTIKIGLDLERDSLYKRIDLRMDQMIQEGLFEEAKRLYLHRSLNALQTVGYSEIFDFMDGAYDKEEAIRLLKQNSRRYAKRQMTWFKKDSEIEWYAPNAELELIKKIESQL